MKRRAVRAVTVPGGARIFHRMFTRLGCQGRPPRFVVDFYPYAHLAHSIRLQEDTAHARLSDLLRGAPLPVVESAAALLLARLYRRQPPQGLAETYRKFAFDRRVRRRIERIRRERSRRAKIRTCGTCYHLPRLFESLNRGYFRGRLRRPHLGWSARPWRTQLGFFDPALNEIVLNSRLDSPQVPRFAVEYVLFHEMLHLKHPIRAARCGFAMHSVAFRKEERRFAQFEHARRFLERLA